MKQTKYYLIFMLMLLIGSLSWGTVSAQDEDIDLPQLFTSVDRIAFRYPADWTLVEDDNFVSVGDENITIEFYTPDLSNSVLQLSNDDLEASIPLFLNILGETTEDTLETQIELDDETFIGAFVLGEDSAQYILIARSLLMEDPGLIFIRVRGEAIDLLGNRDLFLAIIDTFGTLVAPDSLTVRPPDGDSSDADDAPVEVAPCFVRAIEESGTSIHVGPGNNRSVIRFLEADRDFEVLGTAIADDGSIWWRLDKTEAAPSQSAQVNETWVADNEVIQSGGCDSVNTVAAPPIIPIRSTGSTPATDILPEPEAGSTEPFVNFYANPSSIPEGACTDLFWDARNISEVRFQNNTVSPQSFATVCPTETTTYTLRVIPNSGSDIIRTTTVTVTTGDTLVCTFEDIPYFVTSSIEPDGFEYFYIYIDPCQTPTTIFVEMYSAEFDTYIDVYVDNVYYGSDDDSGGNLNAYLEVFLPYGTSLVSITAQGYGGASGTFDIVADRIP